MVGYRKQAEQLNMLRMLENAKIEAEQSAIAKAHFLSNMSHEIRTPLNGIIGLTSLVLDSPLTFDQREMIETVQSSGDLLLSVVNDILDLAKFEAGKLDLHEVHFDIRACVEACIDVIAIGAERKGIEVLCDIAEDVPATMLGDFDRVRQILTNLVGNAVKFTDRGEVVVGVRIESARIMQLKKSFSGGDLTTEMLLEQEKDEKDDGPKVVHFWVKDTGIGIPKDKKDLLFKMYTQIDPYRTNGTGLGLAICKRLVEAMSGKIWATSELGVGSCFHFAVPATTSTDATSYYPPFKGKTLTIFTHLESHARVLQDFARQHSMSSTTHLLGPSDVLTPAQLQSLHHSSAVIIDVAHADRIVAQLERYFREGRASPQTPTHSPSPPTSLDVRSLWSGSSMTTATTFTQPQNTALSPSIPPLMLPKATLRVTQIAPLLPPISPIVSSEQGLLTPPPSSLPPPFGLIPPPILNSSSTSTSTTTTTTSDIQASLISTTTQSSTAFTATSDTADSPSILSPTQPSKPVSRILSPITSPLTSPVPSPMHSPMQSPMHSPRTQSPVSPAPVSIPTPAPVTAIKAKKSAATPKSPRAASGRPDLHFPKNFQAGRRRSRTGSSLPPPIKTASPRVRRNTSPSKGKYLSMFNTAVQNINPPDPALIPSPRESQTAKSPTKPLLTAKPPAATSDASKKPTPPRSSSVPKSVPPASPESTPPPTPSAPKKGMQQSKSAYAIAYLNATRPPSPGRENILSSSPKRAAPPPSTPLKVPPISPKQTPVSTPVQKQSNLLSPRLTTTNPSNPPNNPSTTTTTQTTTTSSYTSSQTVPSSSTSASTYPNLRIITNTGSSSNSNTNPSMPLQSPLAIANLQQSGSTSSGISSYSSGSGSGFGSASPSPRFTPGSTPVTPAFSPIIPCPVLFFVPISSPPPRTTLSNIFFLPKPIKFSRMSRKLETLFENPQSPSTPSRVDRPMRRASGSRVSTEDFVLDPTMAIMHPLTIMVGEDNLVGQVVTQRMLNKLGYTAEFYGSGDVLLTSLENRIFDVILLDLKMPGCDGFECARRICSALPPGHRPHIAAVTANILQSDRDLAAAVGFNDYITKPFLLPDLARVLARCKKLDPIHTLPFQSPSPPPSSFPPDPPIPYLPDT